MQIEETREAEVFEILAELARLEDGDVDELATIESRRHALRFPNPDDGGFYDIPI